MANISGMPTFFPRRLSEYCPAMRYAADVHMQGSTRISFSAPALSVAAGIISAQSIAAAGTMQAASMLLSTMDAPYGRTLSMVLSGAGAGTLTVDGWDYLGQAMSENITYNGATPVQGKKAFKYLRQITWTLVAATTLNVGFSTGLGLPYKAIKVYTEEASSVPVGTVGTLTAGILTDPATATTGDPRGTWVSTTAMDGVTVLTATFDFANDVNAAGNGGLHGIAHFAN